MQALQEYTEMLRAAIVKANQRAMRADREWRQIDAAGQRRHKSLLQAKLAEAEAVAREAK